MIGQVWEWGGAKAIAVIGAVTGPGPRAGRLGSNSSCGGAGRTWEKNGSAIRLRGLGCSAAARCLHHLHIPGPEGQGASKGLANSFSVQPRGTRYNEGNAERWAWVPFAHLCSNMSPSLLRPAQYYPLPLQSVHYTNSSSATPCNPAQP